MKEGLFAIAARRKRDVEQDKQRRSLKTMEARALKSAAARDFAAALKRGTSAGLIAEIKKSSPSAGLIRSPFHVPSLAKAYAAAGARALSVLTERHYFSGDLSYVSVAKKASGLPVLRKDFVVDLYQVFEARAAGADAVLLIAALLRNPELMQFLKIAEDLGMAALVEVHDARELDRALDIGAAIVGVNSRNLKDLSMDFQLFQKLLPKIPARCLRVAESGLKTPEDVKRVKKWGANAFLVGESLMRQKDVESAARRLVKAGK